MFSYYPPDNRFLSPAAIKELTLEIKHDKSSDGHHLIGKVKTMDGEEKIIYLAPVDRQISLDERITHLVQKAEEAIALIGGSASMIVDIKTIIQVEMQKAIDASRE